MSGDPISVLSCAIRDTHGCEAEHLDTAHVRRRVADGSVWSGDVQVFRVDHSRVRRCYAWEDRKKGTNQRRIIAVLQDDRIRSPEDAVLVGV